MKFCSTGPNNKGKCHWNSVCDIWCQQNGQSVMRHQFCVGTPDCCFRCWL